MNVIEINNLTKDFGNNKGIFDLSFSLKQGEIVGFSVYNGAGKTTTIRHLMGFIKANTGSANSKYGLFSQCTFSSRENRLSSGGNCIYG